ncbi:MAG: Stp1/IreP family PP2C-type Ser/Thr phosphatase [Chloroflexaceae bacterium]|nr:Stp1/IreP family PP2C-type Ser/Thr phosphatase [Chloroflexaceae bacterium]
MIVCKRCNSSNYPESPFCWKCGEALQRSNASTLQRSNAYQSPDDDDTRWLEETLVNEPSESVPLHERRTAPLFWRFDNDQENDMSQSQSVEPTRFGQRYEILTQDEQGFVEVADHKPWERCWSCNDTSNEPGTYYCNRCGAYLDNRSYRGMLTSKDAPTGLALIPTIDDEFARSILPPIWDQIDDGDETLVLLDRTGYNTVTLPLSDQVALHVGLDLARLLVVLHSQQMVLGKVQPYDLSMTAANEMLLCNTPSIRLVDADAMSAAEADDLRHLARLLEELTRTPRTTRRLPDREGDIELDEALDGDAEHHEPLFTMVLSQIRTGELASASALASRLDALLQEYTSPTPLRQHVGAVSHEGQVRDHNEDSLLTLNFSLNNTSRDSFWGIYVVADGMGGHAAGEVASSLALRGAAESLLREYLALALDLDAIYDQERVSEIVRQSILNANETVRDAGHARGNDMGTTITLAFIVGDRATIANVGDSRTYLYRDRKLRRITRDHSLVMRLVDLGQITEDDIYTHPQRNAVLRSLGDQGHLEVDIFVQRLQPGDALLLCSDGLWEMIRDLRMETILATYPDDPQSACQELIHAANEAGGEDNITSVLVQLTE